MTSTCHPVHTELTVREVRGGHGRPGAVSTRHVRPEAQVAGRAGEACYAASIRPLNAMFNDGGVPKGTGPLANTD